MGGEARGREHTMELATNRQLVPCGRSPSSPTHAAPTSLVQSYYPTSQRVRRHCLSASSPSFCVAPDLLLLLRLVPRLPPQRLGVAARGGRISFGRVLRGMVAGVGGQALQGCRYELKDEPAARISRLLLLQRPLTCACRSAVPNPCLNIPPARARQSPFPAPPYLLQGSRGPALPRPAFLCGPSTHTHISAGVPSHTHTQPHTYTYTLTQTQRAGQGRRPPFMAYPPASKRCACSSSISLARGKLRPTWSRV